VAPKFKTTKLAGVPPWILGLTPKLKKNGGRSALYFIPFGVSEIRQSTGKISCGAKIQNHKISGRSAVYFIFWGESELKNSHMH
jgi:hypothetical protein